MHKHTIHLKQHTPIIHFQHDQHGATLRATELKPKLDNYIMERLLREKLTAEEFEALDSTQSIHHHFKANAKQYDWLKWLVGKGNAEHVALDYKVRIQVEGAPKRYVIGSMPRSNNRDEIRRNYAHQFQNADFIGETQYFADNQFIDPKPNESPSEAYANIRIGLLHEGTIAVSIICIYPSLLQQIANSLDSFFLVHNFGTRKSKGFGCFVPKHISDSQIENFLKEEPSVKGFFKKIRRDQFAQNLQDIAKDYGLLKRGKSYDGYQKSQLWTYMCRSRAIRWEKRKIKIELQTQDPRAFGRLKYDNGTRMHRIADNSAQTGSHYYVRALLGLAEQIEFVNSDNSRLTVKIADTLSLSNNNNDKIRAIDRFKSPIQFLITDKYIYLLTFSIPELLYKDIHPNGTKTDREFQFKMVGTRAAPFNLTIPHGLDLAAFIQSTNLYGINLKP